MFEIIIFFVVISVISNILRAIGNSKLMQQGEGKGEVGAGPERSRVQEHRVEGIPKKPRIRIQTPAPQVSTPQETRPQYAPEKKVAPKDAIKASPQPKVGSLKLTPHRLAEGIILSEILAPPKSLRQKVR